jgi:hypothetical protein
MNFKTLVTASLLAVYAAGAAAGPAEIANAAAAKASKLAVKVEGAVKRGLGKAASAVEHGGAVAGKAVNNTASKLVPPAHAGTAD